MHLRGKYQSQTSMPSTQGTVLAGEQKNCLFMQATGAVFQDEAGLSGVNDLENGRGVALADLNEDGRLEVLVANIHHAPSIYQILYGVSIAGVDQLLRQLSIFHSVMVSLAIVTLIRAIFMAFESEAVAASTSEKLSDSQAAANPTASPVLG